MILTFKHLIKYGCIFSVLFSTSLFAETLQPTDNSIDATFIQNGKVDPKISKYLTLRNNFFHCNDSSIQSKQVECYLTVANEINTEAKKVLNANQESREAYADMLLIKSIPQSKNKCNQLFPSELRPLFMSQILSCNVTIDLENYKEIILLEYTK